jgi:hypothetical protein
MRKRRELLLYDRKETTGYWKLERGAPGLLALEKVVDLP